MAESKSTRGKHNGRASNKTASRRAKSATKKKQRRAWPVIRGILIVVLALLLATVVGAAIFYETAKLPDPNEDFTTQTTKLYYNDGQTELGTLAIQNREVISYADMPQSIKDAVVAAEDRTFWTNQGIDLKGMTRAFFGIVRNQEVTGGSTITQQYIKIRYLTSERTLSRKFKELALAIKMNKAESKEEVLAGYLNTIYFGRGAYGVQAAAKAYFGIDAKDLGISQAAALAAMVNSPSNLDPASGEDAAQALTQRYNYVLDGMADMGTITQEDHDASYGQLPEFPQFQKSDTFGGPKGFLIDMAINELKEQGFTETQINGGGLKITTTFDVKRQQGAVDAVENTKKQVYENALPLRDEVGNVIFDENGEPKKPDINQLHTGLVSIDVPTGEVVAMYGGEDFVANSRNWATTPRYPASTFKLYGVIAGLRNGYGLTNPLLQGNAFIPPGDSTMLYNYGGANYGPTTLKTAAQLSLNTPFVDMMTRIPNGFDELVRAASDAGVPENDTWKTQGGRLVLGMGEVTVLNNTQGYATVANQGKRIKPHVVREVVDANGNSIYKANFKGEQTIEQDVAKDAIESIRHTDVAELNDAVGGRDVARKTGTEGSSVADSATQGDIVRSAWVMGFTTRIATGVMMVAGDDGVQNLQPYGSGGATFLGEVYPAQIFNEYMRVAVDGTPIEKFPNPSGIQPSVSSTLVPEETATSQPPAPPTTEEKAPQETPQNPAPKPKSVEPPNQPAEPGGEAPPSEPPAQPADPEDQPSNP